MIHARIVATLTGFVKKQTKEAYRDRTNTGGITVLFFNNSKKIHPRGLI